MMRRVADDGRFFHDLASAINEFDVYRPGRVEIQIVAAKPKRWRRESAAVDGDEAVQSQPRPENSAAGDARWRRVILAPRRRAIVVNQLVAHAKRPLAELGHVAAVVLTVVAALWS